MTTTIENLHFYVKNKFTHFPTVATLAAWIVVEKMYMTITS